MPSFRVYIYRRGGFQTRPRGGGADPDYHHSVRKYEFIIMRHSEPGRRSTRLKDHDYSTPGAYFITVCTQDRLLLFGRVIDGKMAANRLGSVVEGCWIRLPDHYDNVILDAFVLMPNHIHGVVIIQEERTVVGAGFKPALSVDVSPKRHALPEIVRAFKTFSARKINEMRASPGSPVWQRGFYEHVIRNEDELDKVRTYIMDNPSKWSEDIDNPVNWPPHGRVSNPPLQSEIGAQ